MFDTQFRSNQIHPSVYIATGAVIVGDVTLAEGSSIWFNAVLRADTEPIMVGSGTNIQDGAVLHVDPGFPIMLGAGVTVGHRAVVHGAKIGNNSLIGMGAIVLNGSKIGSDSLVGAGALVTEGKQFPPGSLLLGSPAKVVRALTADEIERNRRSAAVYIQRAEAFRTQVQRQSMSTNANSA